MKSVLISIRPQWCEKIVNGEKTIEVRKTAPKEVPFKCYIYMTQGTYKNLGLYSESIYQNRMKVIGEFICDKVEKFDVPYPAWDKVYLNDILKNSCLTYTDLHSYIGSGNSGYGWHISDLKIYDKPKKLDEFERPCPYQGNCRSECQKGKFKNDGMLLCSNKITRPPQSYMETEEIL